MKQPIISPGAFEKKIKKGQANGYAGLDANAKVTITQLPFVGFTKITVASSEPTSPSVGDLWVDTG